MSKLNFAREEDRNKMDKLKIRFKDYFHQYRAINNLNGKKSYTFSTKHSFDEKESKLNTDMKEMIAKLAGINDFSLLPIESWVTHPTYQWATFAVVGNLVDMILPETIVDSIGIYTDVITDPTYGNSFSFDVKPRDLFVVSKGSNAKRRSEVHKQFEGQVTALPVTHELTVQVSLYKVLAEKESLAEFAMKAARSLETDMTKDAYYTFHDAMEALPSSAPTNLKIDGFSQDTAVTLAQTVTAYNQGSKAVFVGTQNAVNKILPANSNFRYDLESDYVKFGYIPRAFGYDIMVLPQIADANTPFKLLLDDKKIYVISPSSQKLIKQCIEGNSLNITDGQYDNANLTQNTTMIKRYASVVATNAIAGQITLA